MFKGSIVALVTPFSAGKVDEKSYVELIEWHIEQGTHGIVPCGTTGESATLTFEEHKRVVELCVNTVDKRIPVIAGAGSNSTAEATILTKYAADAGADAALLVSPYCNKPTQEGLYRHYMTIASSVSLPFFIYNVPGRTAMAVSPETIARLSTHENIIGVKDAVGNLSHTSNVIGLCGDDFTVLSGDDFLTFPMMAIGGKGVISVSANIVPNKISAMTDAFYAGEWDRAKELHYETQDLSSAMFIESNPIPVKTALALMGKINGELRLPLCEMSQMNNEKLQAVLRKMSLLDKPL